MNTSLYTKDEAIAMIKAQFNAGYRRAQANVFADHYMVQYQDLTALYNKGVTEANANTPFFTRMYAKAGMLLNTAITFRLASYELND